MSVPCPHRFSLVTPEALSSRWLENTNTDNTTCSPKFRSNLLLLYVPVTLCRRNGQKYHEIQISTQSDLDFDIGRPDTD